MAQLAFVVSAPREDLPLASHRDGVKVSTSDRDDVVREVSNEGRVVRIKEVAETERPAVPLAERKDTVTVAQ